MEPNYLFCINVCLFTQETTFYLSFLVAVNAALRSGQTFVNGLSSNQSSAFPQQHITASY